MKKIFTILLVGALELSIGSCKGFLNVEPTSSVAAEQALSTIEDAQVAVNGMYTLLKYYLVYGSYMIQMGDMRADLLYPREISGTGYIAYSHDYEASSNSYFSLWEYLYITINRANNIIKNIGTLEISSSEQETADDFLGQAYAIRAFCYFNLARLYGKPYLYDNGASLGAVIVEEPIGPEEALSYTRSSIADTYTLINSDIATALPLLSKSRNTGHMNYWAAEFLKAKVALYQGDYSTAYVAAKDVIDNGPYSLIPNSNFIDSWSEEGNDESIFEGLVSLESPIDGDNGFGGSFYYYLWFGSTNTGASVIPTKQWRDLVGQQKNDVRNNWIQYDDPGGSGKGTGEYWLRKFPGNDGLTAFMNNPRYMRLAEAYLIAAEAALETGKGDAAALLLAVVQRADSTQTSVTATLERIKEERAKELIGEGDRFFDLMRRGQSYTRDATDPHETNTEVLSWDNNKVALPISSNEIITHPNLQQNPGY